TLRAGCSDRSTNVIDHVRLGGLHPPFVPGPAVLPATPQVRHGVYAARLEPPGDRRREAGLQRNIEATIAVQDRGIVTLEPGALAGNDVERHVRAVLARIKYLPGLIAVGIEPFELRSLP